MTEAVLTPGVDTFTLLDLFERAAGHKDLTLHRGNGSRVRSEPITTYVLDEQVLAALAQRGIRREPRPDCRDEIFTLVDQNPQEHVPGWVPSCYWNFKQRDGAEHQFDLRMTLGVHFYVHTERRGIVLVPQASGSFVSPVDRLPNFRMFQALVEHDDAAPAIAKELAASDGDIVVTWTDLGLGGIRSITALFDEFAQRREAIVRLGGNHEVFQPDPHPPYQRPVNELFVAEPAQPRVFDAWRAQLSEYRALLVA